MSCDEEQQEVDDLVGRIELLSEELQVANPGDKPHIIAQIDAAQKKLGPAQSRLTKCLNGQRLRCTLRATVSLKTSHAQAAGPFTIDGVEVKLLFEGDPLSQVNVIAFPNVVPP